MQRFAARLRLHALTRQKRHIWLQLGGFELRIQDPPDRNFATTSKLMTWGWLVRTIDRKTTDIPIGPKSLVGT